MSENSLIDYLRKGLKSHGHFCKHNDGFTVGIPDVSIGLNTKKGNITKWIEAKASDEWPVRETTKIWWPHYTEDQALWLRKRDGWLFVRIRRSYFLFDGQTAWRIWENKGFTRQEILDNCTAEWHGNMKWLEFVENLLWRDL